MSEPLNVLFDRIEAADDQARVDAYLAVLARTDTTADVYAQWTRLEGLLVSPNNHSRSIGGQLVSHFAAVDTEGRVFNLWDRWKSVAADKMFVTGRHTLQASPRMARGGAEYRHRLLAYYDERFGSCVNEKNAALIRYDLHVCLREVYDQKPETALLETARRWQALEPDPKYQVKNKKVWGKLLG
jgi:hypothetical protein